MPLIYLKSFLRRIKLKSALELGLLFSLAGGLLTQSFQVGLLLLPLTALVLLFLSWAINQWAISFKKTHIPCKLCPYPHCDLLYPPRRKSPQKNKGSFACSSFDHAQYPAIFYCPQCHNAFLADMVNENFTQTKNEGDKLYKEVADHQYLQQIGARYQTYQRILEQYLPYFQDKKVLEIGCYYGAFYEKVRHVAKSYKGIEPSSHAGRYLREKYPELRSNLYNGLLEEARNSGFLETAAFDTIVLFDVLEHLPNPKETLLHLRSHLKEGGHIIYSTINIEAIISLMMGPFWPWFMDMHYYYFSDRGYRELFVQSHYIMVKHAHFPYAVTAHYFLSKVLSLFLGISALPKSWESSLAFTLPIKLGDTVLIIGEKKEDFSYRPHERVPHPESSRTESQIETGRKTPSPSSTLAPQEHEV